MKISICGKGGTGKSTLTYLLAKEFEKRNFYVIVIDSDESNTSLYKLFGFKNPPTPLIELVGGKKSIQRKLKQLGGFQITQSKISIDEIRKPFIEKEGKINLVTIGKILQAYEGCACPMGALTKEFLKKLNLKDNEIAIVDTEAGIEHFGRGIEKYIDLVIILINTSYESIDVAEKIREISEKANLKYIFVLNFDREISESKKEKIFEILKSKNIDIAIKIPYCEDFDLGNKIETNLKDISLLAEKILEYRNK